jgi:hypothetical protein
MRAVIERVKRVAGALMVALACSAVALAGNECTSARVAEPFLLPDGSEHPAGKLTLCVSEHYSPVSYLHRTYVDGMAVGMHVSRHSVSEAPASESAYMLFNRGTDSKLRLVGFARPGREHMDLYALQRTANSQGGAGAPGDAGPIVVAARTF